MNFTHALPATTKRPPEAAPTGVALIDEQHARLLTIIASLRGVFRVNGSTAALDAAFAQLNNYVREHFAAEERLMRSIPYPPAELESHLAEHASFCNALIGFLHDRDAGRPHMRKELCDYLEAWLSEHINEIDLRMGERLRRHGQA